MIYDLAGGTNPVIEMPDGSRHPAYRHMDTQPTHFMTKEFWTLEGNPNLCTPAPRLRLPNGVVYTFGQCVAAPDGRAQRRRGAADEDGDARAGRGRKVSGDLLAAQTGVKPAKAVIAAPPICALTDLSPTRWRTPNVWHLSYRFCVSVILMRDASSTR